MEIKDLQPAEVWKIFDRICKIPRPSGHEQEMAAFIETFAKNLGCEVSKDNAGNVFVRKSGRKPAIALQAHMDMVCEKNNGVTHNFLTDPINAVTDGEFVTAQGTTLGADDGIGIAFALAALENSNRELECLFTVEEETTLAGASALQKGLFTATELLNLDSGSESQILIGSAGNTVVQLNFNADYETLPSGMFAVSVKITGLAGGHSGEDIDKKRANAIKLLAVFLKIVFSEIAGARLCDINAGGLSNAIAREAEAVIAVPFADKEKVRVLWNVYVDKIESEWKQYEPGMASDMASCNLPEKSFGVETSENLVNFLIECPHGVLEQGHVAEGIVDGSSNLASVKHNGDKITVTISHRHFEEGKTKIITDEIAAIGEKYGVKAAVTGSCSAWTPNPNNPLAKKVVEAYKQELGFEPKVTPLHVALECACFAKLYPEMNTVSMGPDMWGIHSPDEKLSVASVGRVWKVLQRILEM